MNAPVLPPVPATPIVIPPPAIPNEINVTPPSQVNNKVELINSNNVPQETPAEETPEPSDKSPIAIPVTPALQINNNIIPDSSAIIPNSIEPKMPLITENRNGLDKVDTSHYIDPIERSLASLERSLKADVPIDVPVCVSESSMRLEDNISLSKPQIMSDTTHQNLIAQLGGLTDMTQVNDPIKEEMYMPTHNGFMDKHNMQLERDLIPTDNSIGGITAPSLIPSIFDPIPSAPTVIAPPHHSVSSSHLMQAAIKKEDVKPILTPKPIEDLMGIPHMMPNNMVDRNRYEMEKKMEETKNSNFAQAFKLKQEQNVKNASSWSSLAQAGSPQSVPTVGVNNQIKQKPVMDSFQVSILLIRTSLKMISILYLNKCLHIFHFVEISHLTYDT